VHSYLPHFTGKERDTESGLDYFGARYYGSSMGRMISPDPLPWIGWQNSNGDDQNRFAAYIANPQNLNMYAYVLNNPLSNTDPTGMTCQTNSTDGNTYDDGDGQGCATVDQQDADRLANRQYSATVNANGTQIETDQTYSFSADMDKQSFLQQMALNGIVPSPDNNMPGPIKRLFHNGQSLRDQNQTCSLHLIIDPGSGQNGKPVTGNFHYDSINPFGPASNVPMGPPGATIPGVIVTAGAHGAADVIPDLMQKYINNDLPSGNSVCPNK
jgi:RHS repeat-associated protein